MVEKASKEERMTVDAFLEWDDGTDTRYELIDGRVAAMNPPMPPHALLVTTLGASLLSRVPRGCRVYAGAGARNFADHWNFRVPDVVVSCTRSSKNWIEAPTLVCEILSPSTARLDVTTKLDFYRDLASVQEILVVRTTKRHFTLWRRSDPQWIVEDFIGTAFVPLAATASPVPLDELYAPLDLDDEETSGAEPGDPA
jgi:Uma2 family endonuclease